MLPRLSDGETEQRRAVPPGRLQIRNGLRGSADRIRIIRHDSMRDGKQRRLIAKGIFPGVQLLPEKSLMLLTFFHVHNKSDDEPDHGASSERQADSGD